MSLDEKYCTEVYIQMNDMFPWWDTTITIFNCYEDPQTHIITWFKSTVNDCFWKNTGNRISINGVALDTDNTIVRIPKDTRYIEKFLWEKLPSDEKSSHFTLSVGDIVVKGEVEDTVNEYVSGHRSTDILKKYKGLQKCLVIDQSSDNSGIGRGKPHYFISGK